MTLCAGSNLNDYLVRVYDTDMNALFIFGDYQMPGILTLHYK